MTVNVEELELKDRLSLIESMIAAGRRGTESWGWSFVLWGVAYYIAIAWSTWGRSALAWPVTMIAAGALTGVIASWQVRNQPKTTIGRAIASVWIAMGISMFVLFASLGFSGRLVDQVSQNAFIAVIAAMLGTANATSSMILKWKQQFACAMVWWAAAVASCFGTVTQSSIAFLVAIFLCQIVFGSYAMFCEARRNKQGATHA
jgi:hypothetical protein